MPLRFSDKGPEFPEQLVNALLAGDVVFLCGAGVSAPQLPGFESLVSRCFERLNIARSASEEDSFKWGRFEEVLGSLSRRIVNPADLTLAIVGELQPPPDTDLSHHQTILRLSRDLENRPVIITTNFDTLIERALHAGTTAEAVRALSFAGQDLPRPGGAEFAGIIHIHGRIADTRLGLAETPLVVTSADYGDAYMRSAWVSRFLFDLCRCRTIVLLGYRAGDAPVRYFLNVLEADRRRFPDLRPVYAIDAVAAPDQANDRWAALAVEPIPYEYLPDAEGKLTSHEALWTDLSRLADLAERPRNIRRTWAQAILAKPVAKVTSAELNHVAWLFGGRHDLWSIAVQTITDGNWFDFFAERALWTDRDAVSTLAAWMVWDLESRERFRQAVRWLEKLGKPFADGLAARLVNAGGIAPQWIIYWRLLTISRPERSNLWEESAYALVGALNGPATLQTDIEQAVSLLTPAFRLSSGRAFSDEMVEKDPPQRLADLAWPTLTVSNQDGIRELTEALLTSPHPLLVMNTASFKLQAAIRLSVDIGIVDFRYDANDGAVPSVEPNVQNAHHDGLIFLVELLARLLPSATAADKEAVKAQALVWKSIPGMLGVRLWLHALRQPELFTANEAIAGIGTLSLDLFWSVRRELALALCDRASEASAELVATVEERILAEGPVYYSRYTIDEGQVDWRSHALDSAIWLRLNMLKDAACLSDDGVAALNAIRERREDLNRGVEDRDFFGSYISGVHMVVGDAKPIIDAAEGERLDVAKRTLDSHDIEKQQGWSVFCRTDPDGAFDTLRVAPLDEANAPLWQDLIGALSFPGQNWDEKRKSLIKAVFAALETADAQFLERVVDRMADLYWESPRRTEASIVIWWPRLFAAAVRSDSKPLDPERDLYADLINTAGGKLTQAVLIDIEAQRDLKEPIHPASLAAIQTAAEAGGRQGAMARGALVYAAGFVLTIDGQRVTPLLDAALADNGTEGVVLRRVLVNDSRLSLVASRTFSQHILRGLKELTGGGPRLINAAAKLIGPALSIIRNEHVEADWDLSISDVALALRAKSTALRSSAVQLLKQWIHQVDDDRAVAWRTGIGPLLERFPFSPGHSRRN